MNVPVRIKELTETFDRNLESYKKGIYNKTQVRREFIDPFFEELGWDVANKQGYAEAYKDVIHEDAIKIGGVTKASAMRRASSDTKSDEQLKKIIDRVTGIEKRAVDIAGY
jgi:hypothetical protein